MRQLWRCGSCGSCGVVAAVAVAAVVALWQPWQLRQMWQFWQATEIQGQWAQACTTVKTGHWNRMGWMAVLLGEAERRSLRLDEQLNRLPGPGLMHTGHVRRRRIHPCGGGWPRWQARRGRTGLEDTALAEARGGAKGRGMIRQAAAATRIPMVADGSTLTFGSLIPVRGIAHWVQR